MAGLLEPYGGVAGLQQRLKTGNYPEQQKGLLGDMSFLDQLALAAALIPVVGDVAGAAADTSMYMNDPSSRTMGNYAMSGLGMLPFVPSAGIIRTLRRTKSITGHELGATYRSKNWKTNYTVEAIHDNGDVTVRWADGHKTTHQTPVGKDKKVSP